ncbi:transcriptional regulator with XRE-family HTH domain [Nocardiopsis mwathae]|uniref:Transcriptional regulator with XRE-family HTH domain n=2 Tax=Nocardiopsis mwathae TaxID=1472723 RepID=A0A7W9YEG0_9ACTN|nr:transcriptional regulator with XRE-family HTH domain [Nocardiopsis mwathae]
MTVEQAAERLEWSRARLGHIETGRRKKPLITDIKALLDLYKVTDPREREAILNLTRQARETAWWTSYDDVFTGRFPGFEAAAATISTYEPSLIPGLLQTSEYIAAITKATLIYSGDDIQRVIDARLKRQEILTSPDQPELRAVIDEAALLRLGDGQLMAGQVQHLIKVAEDTGNSVTIQVLEIGAGLHPGGESAFVLMDFDEETSPVVYLETSTDGLYLEDAGEVERYRKLFRNIQEAALTPDRTLAYLKNMLVKR